MKRTTRRITKRRTVKTTKRRSTRRSMRRIAKRRTTRRITRKRITRRKLSHKKIKFTKDENNKSGYIVEYSKSGRSACRHCHNKIEKDTIRFGSVGHIYERDAIFWRHFPDCITDAMKKNIKSRGHIDINGLNSEDTKMVTRILKNF